MFYSGTNKDIALAEYLLADSFAALRKKPIGARDGLLPLMLAVFCVAEAQHIAMYEDGNFLQDIGGAEFARLVKAPETFELQYCKLSGVRSEVFNQLLTSLDADTDEMRVADLIDVVRPLCKFAATVACYLCRNQCEANTPLFWE
jgi:hypothetical protein